MSVTVEISSPANLQRVRDLLGSKTDGEAVDMALEKVIEVYEPPVREEVMGGDLPDEYWDDLFSQPKLPSNVVINAFNKEREDRF
jgi:hypothetical protein